MYNGSEMGGVGLAKFGEEGANGQTGLNPNFRMGITLANSWE